MKITITNKHLVRAKKAMNNAPKDRTTCCLVAQAAKELMSGFQWCGLRFISAEGGLLFGLPRKIQRLITLFDKQKYKELKPLLPASFVVKPFDDRFGGA